MSSENENKCIISVPLDLTGHDSDTFNFAPRKDLNNPQVVEITPDLKFQTRYQVHPAGVSGGRLEEGRTGCKVTPQDAAFELGLKTCFCTVPIVCHVVTLPRSSHVSMSGGKKQRSCPF